MNRELQYRLPCKIQRKQGWGKQHHHRYQKHYQHWQYLPSWRLVRVFPLIPWWFLVLGARQLWIQQLYHAKNRSNGLLYVVQSSNLFDFNWANFGIIVTSGLGGSPSLLGLDGVNVTIFHGESILGSQVFSGDTHWHTDVQIGQTSPESIFQFQISSESSSESSTTKSIWGLNYD